MAGLLKSAWRETKQAGQKISATVSDKTKKSQGNPEQSNVLTVGNRRFHVDKTIGEGGFAYVFAATDVSTGTVYALKRSLLPANQRNALLDEMKILSALPPHKHIIKLEYSQSKPIGGDLEATITSKFTLLGGSLHEHLLRRPRPLTEMELYAQIHQVCLAVHHLHSQNPPITHRDIKCENVLLTDDGTLKLIDFGSCTTTAWKPEDASERSAAEEDINHNTTLAFRAPEMVDLFRKQLVNHKVDVWAIGCMVFRMAFGYIPFEEALGILNMRYTFPETSQHSSNLHNFIRWLLTEDPAARPDVSDVLAHICRARALPVPPLQRIADQPFSRIPGRPAKAEVVDNKQAIASLQWVSNSQEQPISRPIVAPVDDNHFDDAPLPMPGNIGPYRPTPSPAAVPPAVVHAPIAAPAVAPPVVMSSLPPAQVDLAQQLRDLATKAFHSASELWPFQVPPAPQMRSAQATALITQYWINPRRRSLDAFFSLLWAYNISDAAVLLQALVLLHNLILQGAPVLVHESAAHIQKLDALRKGIAMQGHHADCARTYSAFLTRKLRLHSAHPEFEGNLAVDTYLLYANRAQPGTDDLISLGLLNELFSCLSDGLLVAATLFSRPLDAALASLIVPLYTDCYALFSYVTYSFQQLFNVHAADGELSDLIPLYLSKHIALKDFVVSGRTVFDFSALPPLPDLPPELRRGMPCPTVMPKSMNPIFHGTPLPAAPTLVAHEPQAQPQTPIAAPVIIAAPAPTAPASVPALIVPPQSGGRWSPGLSPREAAAASRRAPSPGPTAYAQPAAPVTQPSPQVIAPAPTMVVPAPAPKMQTSAERAANPALNAEHYNVLRSLLALPHNRVCADCRTPSPTWASVTIGAFICHRCSGQHRALGTHISRVKSTELDTWEAHQVEQMKVMGNARVNEIYEAQLSPYDVPAPQAAASVMEKFIRNKYENRAWMAASSPRSAAAAAQVPAPAPTPAAAPAPQAVAPTPVSKASPPVVTPAPVTRPSPVPAIASAPISAPAPAGNTSPRSPRSPRSSPLAPISKPAPASAPVAKPAAPTPAPAPVTKPASPASKPAAPAVQSTPQPSAQPTTAPQPEGQPPPVPPRQRPAGASTRLRARWDFHGTQAGDLSFKKGDIITFMSKIDEGWWEGSLNGEVGIFPVTYVEPAP